MAHTQVGLSELWEATLASVSSGSAASSSRCNRSLQAQAGILAIVWATLLGLVIGVGRLLTGPLQDSVGSTDNQVARWFAGKRSPSLNQVAEFTTLLAETPTVLVLAAAIALGVWVWRRNFRPALWVALATAGATGIYLVAVNAVPRPRPPVQILDAGLDPTHSFPSGHVAAATALYGLIVVLVWTYARVARWWVTPLLLLPLLVMVSRMYEGAHHLSDVLTSVVYASIWLRVTATTLPPRHLTKDTQRA